MSAKLAELATEHERSLAGGGANMSSATMPGAS